MNYEGAIGEIDLVERLVELSRENFTGAIRFEQDGIIKIVYFKGGDILSASTNDRKDAIDEILLRAGKISREHIKQALARRQENETLGDALFNLGFITRKELTWARRVQVIGIVRSVRSWTTGNYAIVLDYLPKREEGTLFPLPQIIVEFIVTEQDRTPFERAMDGGEAVFRKRFDFDEQFPKLDLNEEAGEITAQIDGRKTAADIAVVTAKDAFNVYKLLEALRLLGLIEKGVAKPEPTTAEIEFQTAPEAEAVEAPPSLEAEEPEPDVAPPMTFDEPIPAGQTVAPKGTAPVAMPNWDDVKVKPSAPPAPPAMEIPPPPQRKRTVTTAKVPQKRSRAPLYATIILILLGAAGYGGWMWWQQQQQQRGANAPVVATPRPAVQPAAPPVTTDTSVAPSSTEASTATSTTTIASTTTAAPPIAPAPVPMPAPAPVAKTPAPSATARLETSTSGRTITNTPASTAAASDDSRERYDAMAKQYAQNPSGNFTVQFELVCQPASVRKAIEAGGSAVWFVPTSYRGQSCYRVFWGHFDSRDAATRSLSTIPAALRGDTTPVVIGVPR